MHWIDPDSVPALSATVAQFLFNPHGEADGFILDSGLEAHFPPHLSREVLRCVKAGDRVTLYGVRPRNVDLIACVAIETTGGTRIVDNGPPDKHSKRSKPNGKSSEDHNMELTGIVSRALHGPKGETRGVLLESGEIVRFPPHAAQSLGKRIARGAAFAARGRGFRTAQGTVMEAAEIGRSTRDLELIPRPAKKH